MEFIFSDPFSTISQVAVTVSIIAVAAVAYKRGIFLSRFGFTVLAYEIIYVAVYLSRQYFSGHIAEHAETDSYFALLSSLHAIVSMLAIIQAAVMFVSARKYHNSGINYFRKRKIWTFALIVFWIVSLLTGFFL